MTRGSGLPSAPSVADALNDEDCWWVGWTGLCLQPQNRKSAVNLKYPIEHGIVANWDHTERNVGITFFPATVCRPKMPGIMVGRPWTKRSADIRFIVKEASVLHGHFKELYAKRRVGRRHDPCSKVFFL